MYSCDQQQDHTGTAARSGMKYQPCVVGTAADRPAAGASLRRSSSSTTTADQDGGRLQEPRRTRRRQYGPPSSSSLRRSSTTIVATDVTNFRAMVQELTGFPPAAIFRPLPRRAHSPDSMSAARGYGGGGMSGGGGGGGGAGAGAGGAALHGAGQYSSEHVTAATAAGKSRSSDVPAVQQPPMHPLQQCPPPSGMFDGLADLGSLEFDGWADLSFE